MSAAPPADEAARALFGERTGLAQRFADVLAERGTVEGHIGPREVERLWTRHLVNCGLVGDLVAPGSAVVDVGSGAGLPGLVLAIRRPDLAVVLVEPMLRRSRFLESVVDELGLAAQVRVLRGRAEEAAIRSAVGGADYVTARAVAPLERLVGWCLPLLRPGGTLLALKGESAVEELARAGSAVQREGGSDAEVIGIGDGQDRTWVVSIRARRERGRRR